MFYGTTVTIGLSSLSNFIFPSTCFTNVLDSLTDFTVSKIQFRLICGNGTNLFSTNHQGTSSLHLLSSYLFTWCRLPFPRLCQPLRVGNFSTKITPGQSIIACDTTANSPFFLDFLTSSWKPCVLHLCTGFYTLSTNAENLESNLVHLYIYTVKELALRFIKRILLKRPGSGGDGIWQTLHLLMFKKMEHWISQCRYKIIVSNLC